MHKNIALSILVWVGSSVFLRSYGTVRGTVAEEAGRRGFVRITSHVINPTPVPDPLAESQISSSITYG